MSFLKILESVLLQFVLRIALGGLFCFAAFMKIADPQTFAEAIKAFKILDVAQFETLIITAAYTIPWVEMVAGILLIIGLWTRAAAITLGMALIGFIAALISVNLNGITTSCSCFGEDLSWPCGHEVGWCQVVRNFVLLIPAGYLAWRRGGLLAVDHRLESRRARSAPDGAKKPAEGSDIEFDPIGDRA